MFPSRPVVLLVTLAGSAGLSTPAHGGWGVDPVAVRPTSASIPTVTACNDGGYGTFVVWQEEATPGSGLLRAQHLLPTGDLDPMWSVDGALVSDGAAPRRALGAFPDRLGGVFVWWTETDAADPKLFLTRLAPDGAVGSGWPARGRWLGTISSISPAPRALSDEANGIYLVWTTPAFSSDPTNVKAVHLGPTNSGVAGWPASPRTVVPDDPVPTFDVWPQIALAGDGELFVAWGSWSQDEASQPSAYRLRRLTSAGLNATGWPVEGIQLSAFHPNWLGIQATSLLAASADGRGGVWALVGDATTPGPTPQVSTRLYRLQGDGSSAPDWPASGRAPGPEQFAYWLGQEAVSYRAYSDAHDGAIVGLPETCADCGLPLGFTQVSSTGVWHGLGSPQAQHLEVLVREDGGLDLGSCQPNGPSGPFQPPAFICFEQGGGNGFFESHSEPLLSWFGDVGLAGCGAEGAVFFWSQVRERFGLFARRFSPAGEVTGVPARAAGGGSRLGLRFVPGRGVVARVDLDGHAARLELFDVGGRIVASRTIDGAGPAEVSLPSTSVLPSGLYFARFTSAGRLESGKVVVAR